MTDHRRNCASLEPQSWENNGKLPCDCGTETFGTAAQEVPDDAPARRVRMTPASTIKPRPVHWTWTHRIPAGELTLTPGRGGIGKSTFHAWLIAHLTMGTLPGIHHGRPKPCIIAATEDSWDRTIVPRLIAAAADLNLVYRVDVVTATGNEVHVSLPADLDGLEREIKRLGVALLSVDPLLGVVSGTLDTHKNRDVRQALTPLTVLADRTNCTVAGNAHFSKGTGTDVLSMITGSAAFGEVARAALGFARDPDDEDGSCVISQVKNNLGKTDLPSLRYRIDEATIHTDEGPASVGKFVMLGESDRTVADILRDNGGDDPDERREVDRWLTDYLTDGGGQAIAGDAIKAATKAGFTADAVKKARRRVGARTERRGFGPGADWVWTIDQTPIGAIDAIGAVPDTNGTNGTYDATILSFHPGDPE